VDTLSRSMLSSAHDEVLPSSCVELVEGRKPSPPPIPEQPGESECVRAPPTEDEDGELVEDVCSKDSGVATSERADIAVAADAATAVGSGEKDLGLSLPVGPLPSCGLLAGGRLRARRN
jgi:hypothetical protein